MYIVIAGGDELALRIVEELMTEHDVVMVTADTPDAARLERLDVDVVRGMTTSPQKLREARVNTADFFIATSTDDEKNIVACVAARQLGAGHVICFLARRGFFELTTSEADLAESLGIDTVIRPAALLAEEIVQIVTTPGALDVRKFASGKIQALKFEVEKDSRLEGIPLQRAKLPKDTVLVVGRRGNEFFVPHGSTYFEAGDKLTAIGTPASINSLSRYLRPHKNDRRKRRVVIVGGGLVGSAVAEMLVDGNWPVTVIEQDKARGEDLAAQIKCLVLHGDGADLNLLAQESLYDVGALVAVTSNDEKNLMISLLAKQLGIPRIITRAGTIVMEHLFETVGVDSVLSAHGAALRWVVDDLIESHTDRVGDLEHGDLRVLELELPCDFQPVRLGDMRVPPTTIVGAITRGRQVIIPTGSRALLPGDHIFVFCTASNEAASRRFYLDYRPDSEESA